MTDRTKHRLPALLAALALILALTAACRADFGARPAAQPPAEEEALPAAADRPPGILREGTVAKAFALPVTSGWDGRVLELYVAEGQVVKAGEPLFKMETPPPASRYSYENAVKDYERLQKLYEKGAVPRRQVEIAAANVKALRQSGGSGVVTTVAAPVDGIVADLAAAAGDAVQAGQQVLALGGGQKLAVVVPLQQSELSLVALGAPVEIAVSGRIVNGKVTAIYPEVRGNAVPYFQAHIGVIDPPAGVLEQGMPVVVRIDTGT